MYVRINHVSLILDTYDHMLLWMYSTNTASYGAYLSSISIVLWYAYCMRPHVLGHIHVRYVSMFEFYDAWSILEFGTFVVIEFYDCRSIFEFHLISWIRLFDSTTDGRSWNLSLVFTDY